MTKAPNRITVTPPAAAVTTFTDEPERGIDPALDPHAVGVAKPLEAALGRIDGVDVPAGDLAADLANPHPLKAAAKSKKPTADKE